MGFETNGFNQTNLRVRYCEALLQGKEDPLKKEREEEKQKTIQDVLYGTKNDWYKERRKEFKQQDKESRACEHCGNPSTKLCSKCNLSSFCSAECIRAGWKFHKSLCKQRSCRDSTIMQVLGSELVTNEYCVHYMFADLENIRNECLSKAKTMVALANGSVDVYKTRCISMTASEWDRITCGDKLVTLLFNNKTPGRIDDVHTLAFIDGRWTTISLRHAHFDTEWAKHLIEDFCEHGILILDGSDFDPTGGSKPVPQEWLSAKINALNGMFSWIQDLAVRHSCTNQYCECIFKDLPTLPGPGDGVATSKKSKQHGGRKGKKKRK